VVSSREIDCNELFGLPVMGCASYVRKYFKLLIGCEYVNTGSCIVVVNARSTLFTEFRLSVTCNPSLR
jgi:hypothetical protein